MESRRVIVVAALALPFLVGCGAGTPSPRDSTAAAPPDTSAHAPTRPRVVFLGTSLTAGLGVDPDQAYPALIQGRIDSAGLSFEVQNRGNSGETSAGALARLGWILQAPPRVLVIETGANDGLRGQDPDSTKANIQAIIDRTRSRDSTTRILLVQMEAMPNLGRRYVARFHAIYPELAAQNRVTLIPFLLEGVAGVDSLNQADGIHPTPRGHQIVAGTVWKGLRPTLTAIVEKGPR
jgi:acyl-CoA thioesterase-1